MLTSRGVTRITRRAVNNAQRSAARFSSAAAPLAAKAATLPKQAAGPQRTNVQLSRQSSQSGVSLTALLHC